MAITDICKQVLTDWMIANAHTLANHPRRDFSDHTYTNWYISGKKNSAWKRRASGTHNGQRFRAFTRSGNADLCDIPVQDLKASPEKFWIVWIQSDGSVDRIEWMNDAQLSALGAKDTFPKNSHMLDWYW